MSARGFISLLTFRPAKLSGRVTNSFPVEHLGFVTSAEMITGPKAEVISKQILVGAAFASLLVGEDGLEDMVLPLVGLDREQKGSYYCLLSCDWSKAATIMAKNSKKWSCKAKPC